MKNLVIIGAGGFGRVIYSLAERCIDSGLDLVIKGFLDDNLNVLDGYQCYAPVLSSINEYTPQTDDAFICAISDYMSKRKCVEIIQSKGGEFISLVDPSSYLGKNVVIGKGCIINREVSIGQDAIVGDFVTFDGRACISHDDMIGDYSHIGATAFVAGNVKVGKCVTIHPGSHIVPGRRIGDYSTIGVGSVVVANVKENTTVFGNPAKKIIL